MTPDEVEARFQRIEAILAQTAQENAERDRRLAEERAELNRRLAELVEENAERDRRVDLMMIGINALVESSIDYKRWKVETDQRFNILLEEVRSLNKR